jgi:hypothetical protein
MYEWCDHLWSWGKKGWQSLSRKRRDGEARDWKREIGTRAVEDPRSSAGSASHL